MKSEVRGIGPNFGPSFSDRRKFIFVTTAFIYDK
jgi:hypothetical protein